MLDYYSGAFQAPYCVSFAAAGISPFTVELYLRLYYGQGISTHHLGILAETSLNEAVEFLGNKVWLLAAVMVAMPRWFARASPFVSGAWIASFLSAFKEAKFKTFWLSNQLTFGQFGTPTSVFAKEADRAQFF